MTLLPRASEFQPSSVPLSTLFKSSSKVYSQLDDYQQRAVRFAYERRTTCLFLEQGTGKTWIAAGLLECLGSSQSSLLVVPKNNKETSWYDTLKANFPHIYVHTSWDNFKRMGYYGVLILHYEQVPKLIKKLVRRKWTCICYDESQRLKDRGSKASRCARRLRHLAEYKLALSGTPADGDPTHIWGQMRFVNPIVFGDVWDDFFQAYMKSGGFMGYKKIFREEMRPQFIDRLKMYALRESIDVLNLPELHIKEVWVNANERQRAAYWDMRIRKQCRLTRKVSVQAPLVITRDMYLAQIAGGFIQHEDDVYWLSYRKVLKVQSILRNNPGPTVIFCRFIPELLMLEAKLSKRWRVATYYGKTKNKPDVQRRFQAGEYDVLICQIRSGGTGLDLFKARCTILYSANWSSIDFNQLMRRFHRRGQTFEVTFFLVMVRNTIDAKLRRRIVAKSNDNDQTLNKLRREDHGKVHRHRPRGEDRPRAPHRPGQAASAEDREKRRGRLRLGQ